MVPDRRHKEANNTGNYGYETGDKNAGTVLFDYNTENCKCQPEARIGDQSYILKYTEAMASNCDVSGSNELSYVTDPRLSG